MFSFDKSSYVVSSIIELKNCTPYHQSINNTTGYQDIDTYISMFLYMYRFGLSDPQEIGTVYFHRLSRLSPPHQLVHD